MKPILYIMCGLGFSGKSTLAKKIADHQGARLVSTDSMFTELGLESDNYEQWLALLETAKDRARDSLTQKTSVVYDHPNVKLSERNELRKIAEETGPDAVVVYLATPSDTISERQIKNRETKERHDPKQEHLDAVLRDFEPPTASEIIFKRSPDQDIDTWLADLERFVKWRSSMPQIIKDVGFDFSWDSKKVWALDEPVVDMDIDELIWHFDIPFWEVKDTDDYNLSAWKVIKEPSNEAHSEHLKKVEAADLKYPIDIMENKGRWLILDGLHRLVKAYTGGAKTVKVRKIPRSRIPEISK